MAVMGCDCCGDGCACFGCDSVLGVMVSFDAMVDFTLLVVEADAA